MDAVFISSVHVECRAAPCLHVPRTVGLTFFLGTRSSPPGMGTDSHYQRLPTPHGRAAQLRCPLQCRTCSTVRYTRWSWRLNAVSLAESRSTVCSLITPASLVSRPAVSSAGAHTRGNNNCDNASEPRPRTTNEWRSARSQALGLGVGKLTPMSGYHFRPLGCLVMPISGASTVYAGCGVCGASNTQQTFHGRSTV